jgi:hypothetical protein
VLLDECIDEGLRHHFAGHDCQSCRYAGMAGLSNGVLLAKAEQAGFEVMVTVDRNMPAQQNLRGRTISLVVIRARTTDLIDLLPLMPRVLECLDGLPAGVAAEVGW